MNKRRRLLPRLLFLCFAGLFFAAGLLLALFQAWRMDRLVDLFAGSEVADLPLGAMEFTRSGDGPPVLVFHSTPGGYDQALAFGGFIADAGFEIIAPSRPGYLRTPLATGASPGNQADAAAQLLDFLSSGPVAVVGVGWGGPVALEFARRFPDRTKALILVSAVSQPVKGTFPEEIEKALGGTRGTWLALGDSGSDLDKELSSAAQLTLTGSSDERDAWVDQVRGNPDQLALFQELILSILPRDSRMEGLRNDVRQASALPQEKLSGITPPVLVVHGALDKAVPVAHAEVAKSKIAGSELLVLPGEGHLVLLGRSADAAKAGIVSFLNKHLKLAEKSHAE